MFKRCDHCGREDVGSAVAGIAEVSVPIVNPTNHREVLGHETLYVCDPPGRYRPRCRILVTDFAPHDTYKGHTRNCGVCFQNYPPGAEFTVMPEEGKWAAHDAWMRSA